jgi:hypothetical protein
MQFATGLPDGDLLDIVEREVRQELAAHLLRGIRVGFVRFW